MKVWIQSLLVLGVLTMSVLARSVSAIRIGTAATGILGPIGDTGDTGSSFPPSFVLSIESGGTNSSTALMGSKLIVSKSNQLVEGTSLLNPTFDSIILEDSILIGATRLQPSSSSSSSLSSSSSSRFVLRIPFETGISSNEVLLDQGDQIVQGRKTFAGSWIIESDEERCLLVTGSLQVNDFEMRNATVKIDNTIESKLSTNTLQLEESGFKIRDTGNFFELGADFQMNFENRNGIRFNSTGGQMILESELDQSWLLTFGPNPGAHSTWQFRPTKENQTIQLRAPSDSEFVMTEGNTVLQHLKTFTNIGGATIPVPIEVLSETGQMVFGGASGTQSIVVQGIPTVGIKNYKIPHTSNDSFFVMTEGDMEVFGTKTFTNLFPRYDQGISVVTTGGNQIILGPTGSQIALNFEISSSGTNPISFQETVPNVHTGAEFVLADGDSNIRGDKVFTDVDAPNEFNVTGVNTLAKVNDPLRLTATNNQLVLGTSLTKTINCPTPSAPRIYSIPVDNKTDSEFVMTEGSQSLDNVLFAGNISHEDILQVPSISIGNLITGKTYRAAWRMTTQPVITTSNTLLNWDQEVYNQNWLSWPLFPKTGLYLVSMSLEYVPFAFQGKGHGICCPFPYDPIINAPLQVWGTTDINSDSNGPLTASGFFEVNNLATQQFYSYGQLSGYSPFVGIQLTTSCVVEISLLTEYG